MSDLTTSSMEPFLKSKEGKIALYVGLPLAAVLGVYELGTLMHFLAIMMEDTIHFAEGAAILTGAAWLVFSSKARLIERVMFRRILSFGIPIYKKQVVEDHIQQMKEREKLFNKKIGEVSGALRKARDRYAANAKDQSEFFDRALSAKRQLEANPNMDTIRKAKLNSVLETNSTNGQHRKEANETKLTPMINMLQSLYEKLSHAAIVVHSIVETTEDAVKQEILDNEAANAGFGAMSACVNILKGNGFEDDVFSQAMASYADDTSMKLGAIDDLFRVTSDVMDNADIDRGVVSSKGLAALDAYDKALSSGNNALGLGSGSKQIPTIVAQTLSVDDNVYSRLLQ